MDLLCYCAAYQTGGYLPHNIADMVAGASVKYLSKCSSLELVDVVDDELRIHDWENYAPKDPTAAERQAAWRRSKRNGGVTVEVTGSVTDESSTSRAGTARVPVPSRPKKLFPKAVTRPDRTASDQEMEELKGIIDRELKEAS